MTLALLLLATLPIVLSLPWNEPQRNSDIQNLPLFLKNQLDEENVRQLVRSQSSGTFRGCYSDTDARIVGNAGLTIESDQNINADCKMTCKEEGYTVASTKGHNCYCTNSLPLPLLYPANDKHAAGNNGPCGTTCPGAWTEESCQGDECCGGENAYSVFILDESISQQQDTMTREHNFEADIQSLATFDGCYSSATLDGSNKLKFIWNDNYNAKCQRKCQDEGLAIASTKGNACYCTNILPLPQLARSDNTSASGNGGPCSTVCPGVYTTGSCRGDECCGGASAVSVYIVGFIDALKELERRVIDRVMHNVQAKELVQNFHTKDQWIKKSTGTCDYTTAELISSGPVAKTKRNVVLNQFGIGTISLAHLGDAGRICDVDRISIVTDYHTPLLKVADLLDTSVSYNVHVGDAFTTVAILDNYAGRDLYKQTLNADRTQGVIDINYNNNAHGTTIGVNFNCGGMWIQYVSKITVEAWGKCPGTAQSGAYGVSVIGMGRTATASAVGVMKVYSLSKWDEQETLNEIPVTKSPLQGDDKTELRLVNMEKLIDSNFLVDEKPLGSWDVACDNTFGSGDLTCKKDYTQTTSFEQSWSTEHGFNMEVTVGAEFETGALFAKAKTTFELSLGYSFSSGYSKTKSEETSETFGIEGSVPAGAKMEARFYQADVPVQVKWRASIFADGYVLVKLLDAATGEPLNAEYARVHLSQILSYNERTLYAFGTIDYGERLTLIARTKVIDRNGNVLSSGEQDHPLSTLVNK